MRLTDPAWRQQEPPEDDDAPARDAYLEQAYEDDQNGGWEPEPNVLWDDDPPEDEAALFRRWEADHAERLLAQTDLGQEPY